MLLLTLSSRTRSGADLFYFLSGLILWAVLLSCGIVQTARAQAPAVYNVTESQSLYGHLDQHLTWPNLGAQWSNNMCGATAFVNSFVYLQNEYPSIYGHALVPGNDYVDGQPSQADLIATADLLASPTYINLFGSSLPNAYDVALPAYMQAVAPNTTVINGQANYYYTGYGNTTPTWQFICDALLTNSTVEIGIYGPSHILSVTGFHFTDVNNDGIIDAGDGATINVIDPWTGQSATLPIWQDSSGFLDVSYSSGYTGNQSVVGQILWASTACPNQWSSSGSAAWSSTSSWLGPVPNGPGAKANFLNFATAATTVTLDSSQTVGALNFDSLYGYSLVAAGSSTLTLSQPGGAATIAVTNVFGNGAHTIAAPLVLASPLVITQNSSSPLTITGPISDGGNGLSLTMNGPGNLVLGGSNTYSGGTVINGGTLQLGNNNALGNGPGGLTADSGVLDLAGYSPTVFSLAGSAGAIINSGTAPAALTVAQSTATTFFGTLQDGPGNTLALLKTGNGILTLAGSNSYSGGTTIADGTLQVGSGGVLPGNVLDNSFLAFSLPGTSTFAGNVNGAGGLVQSGGGVLVLAGSNTYSGGTFIQGGAIALGAPNSLPTAGAVTLGSVGTSGTLDLAGFDQQIGGLAVGSGDNSAAQIVGNSSTVRSSTLTFGSGTSTFAGVIQDSLANGNQNVGLTVSGGQLTLTGRNTYSGPTTITGGILNAATWCTLPPQSQISINGGQLIAAGAIQNVGSLTVGPGGTLDLNLGTVVSCNGPVSLNGSLSLLGSAGGPQLLVIGTSLSGSFSSVSGVPYGYAIAYNPDEVDLAYGVNDSVLSVSASSVSLGRVMLGSNPTVSVTIANSGTLPTGADLSAGGTATVSPGNYGPGAISASGSAGIVLGLAASATGSYSGTVQVLNSGDGGFGGGPSSAGPNQGSAQSPILINLSGTVVGPRVVTASAVDLGRFMANQSVGGTSTLSTSGDDSSCTRVTVNGTLFNSATSTSSYNLSLDSLAPGPVNGSVTLPVTGEGLPGEGAYAGVIVSYTGESLLDRIVTSTSANFGLVHVGQSISQPITLSTTGLDNQYTRVSVNNAGPDGNGFAVIGGANPLFNSPAVTDNRTLSGTPTIAGFIDGTILLATNGEGLSGESPVPVQVNYSGQVFSGNAQWSGASGSASWAVNANWNDTVAAGIHAAPGTWGVTGDAATLGAGPAGTITLDGANPSLGSLCFDNSSASYTLASGSGGTLQLDNGPGTALLTVAAGSHTIAAPVILNSLTEVAVLHAGDTLTVSGVIGGSGGLAMNGSGLLCLAGSNSYSGGTTVSAGTLQLGSNAALGTGGLAVNGGLLDLAGWNPVLAGLSGAGGVIFNSGSNSSMLTVNQSATTTFGGTLADGPGGLALMLNGSGMLTLAGSSAFDSLSLTAGTLACNGILSVNGPVSVGGTGSTGTGSGQLIVNPGGTLTAGSALYNYNGGVTLNGGTIREATFAGLPLTFNAGTLEYTGDLTVSASDWLASTLGPGHPLGAAQQLKVDGTTTLNDLLTLNGGTFSTGYLINPGMLQFNSGTLNITGDNLSISGSGLFGNTLTVPFGAAVNVTNSASIATGASLAMQGGLFSAAMLTNSGTIGGSGQIAAPLTNAPGGQVCAFTGDHSVFSGGSNVNQGQIQLSGGTVEFIGRVTNNPTGLIEGNGSLLADSGLLNLGTIALSVASNIAGTVHNGQNALITTASGTTIFQGNVVNNGTIFTAAGGFSIFDGTVSGDGSFAGPGTPMFTATLSPGHSPGILSFANDADFTGTSEINIELGGTTPGTQYDQVLVSGNAALAGGSLNVTLLNGFRPAQNEQFTVLGFGSRSGDFATETGLDLGGRLQLVPAYSGNSLVLTAVQGGSGTWQVDSDGAASVSANWSGGLPSAADDTATFGPVIGQPRTVTIDQPTTWGNVVLDSSLGYTLSGSGGNTLTLDNSGSGAAITVTGGQHAITASLVLADNLVVQSGSGSPWTLALGGSNGISETGGSRCLTMNGPAGVLILSGVNSYSGGTTVSAGTLQLGNNNALGTGGLTINGGLLDLAGWNPLIAGLSGTGGAISNSGSNGSTLSVNQSAVTTFGGTLADGPGGLALAMNGPGLLCLAGSNSYSGGTTVSAGTLQLGSNNALGTGGLAVNGGLLDLAGWNPVLAGLSGTGGAISNSGSNSSTLTVNQSAATTFGGTLTDGSGGLALVLNGSGMLTLAGSSAFDSLSLTAGTLACNGVLSVNGPVYVGGNGPAGAGNGQLAVNPGGTLTVGGTLNTFSGGVNLNGGTIRASAIGGLPLAFSAGTLEYTGDLTISASDWLAGTLGAGHPLAAAQQLKVDGTTTLNDVLTLNGGTFSTGNLANAGTLSFGLAGTAAGTQYGQVAVAGNAALVGGSLNVTLLNGFRPAQNEQFTVLSFGSRSGDFAAETGLDLGNRLQLVPAYSGNSLVLTAVQGGSGTWQVDSDGNASVSANWSGGLPSAAGDTATFGPVIVQPRTVTIDQPTTWGNVVLDSSLGYTLSGGNTLTLDNSGSGAAITLTGGQHAITAPLVLADNLVVQSGSGSPWTLVLGGSNGISETGGSRSLTMNGPGGTLILSGVNTYSGGTTVAAGTLVVTSNTALANDSSLTVDAGGTFVFDPSLATTADSSDNAGLMSTAGGVQIYDAAVLQPSLPQNAPVGEAMVIAVPEPGTFTLLLIAGLSLSLARRRIAGKSITPARKYLT